MRAATNVKKISPQNPFYMVGYLSKERELPALGIHDDPLCVSLMLEIKKRKLLFIGLDVCVIEKKKADIIKDNILEAVEMDRDDIIINAIHTHSGPSGLDSLDMAKADSPGYFELVRKTVVECVKDLIDNLQEVTAEIGNTVVHGFYSNRNDINKPYDDEAYIIRFRNEEGEIVSAMCNFNCHCTVLGPANRYATSDLIGEVRRNLSEHLGVIPYTFTGSSGDISNRQLREGNDFNELERVGKGVSDILKNIKDYRKINLDSYEMRHFSYRVNYDNFQYYDEYRKELEKVTELLDTDLSLDQRKLLITEKKQLSEKLKINEVDFTVSCKIIKMGDVEIITFPGELVSKFGMELKKKNKDLVTIILGYADDYKGYFVEAEEYGKCYETIATNTPKGVTEQIIERLEEFI